jgi:lipoyl(octanoyl) transferase
VSERVLEVRRLGLVTYGEALELQKQLVEDRKAGRIPDQLLLLEHPSVITLGVRSRDDRSHVLATAEDLEREGIELFETGRGGDVTFHGPGQLIGYPILDLRPDRLDVHRYVRDLEEVTIRVAAAFGVTAARSRGLPARGLIPPRLAAFHGGTSWQPSVFGLPAGSRATGLLSTSRPTSIGSA